MESCTTSKPPGQSEHKDMRACKLSFLNMSENISSQMKILKYWWLQMTNVVTQTQIFAITACISPRCADDFSVLYSFFVCFDS